MSRRWWILLSVALLAGCREGSDRTLWRDDLSEPADWSAHPADGVRMQLGRGEGLAVAADAPGAPAPEGLRIDYGFEGGGWAIARREVGVDLPENYRLAFWIRGEGRPQTVELKLLDTSGQNVWWKVWRDLPMDDHWRQLHARQREIVFAWGPRGGGRLEHLSSLEIAITASGGGEGSVWIDELVLQELPPADRPLPEPVVTASSHASDESPSAILDGDPRTTWSPRPADSEPWIALDLGAWRELGLLEIDWAAGSSCDDYVVEASDDGRRWRSLHAVTGSNGGRDRVPLFGAEARRLRLRWEGASDAPVALADLHFVPPEEVGNFEELVARMASDSPRGTFPRAYHGEQDYWTVVGVDADQAECLLGEDGAVELGPWQPRLEPFLTVDDELWTWADVERTHGLGDGDLPLPWVAWERGPLRLRLDATAFGPPGRSVVTLRCRLENLGESESSPRLHLALRPFQVNPPQQALNRPGGMAPLHRLRLDERGAEVNGRRVVRWLDAPDEWAVSSFHGGMMVAEHLRAGALPVDSSAEDPTGAASGVASWRLQLPPGETREITVLLALHPESIAAPEEDPVAWVLRQRERARSHWRERVDRVSLQLPPSARWIEETVRAQLAYVRVNRDGAAIQPGSRSYARSWIRDGALTSSALLQLGQPEVATDFLEWYAPHQAEDGRVPCVVDARGGDPVLEHDSNGEFVFLVAETLRHTGDHDLAERMWPHVERAAAYLDSLRQLRRTEEYRREDGGLYFGLLPESISHEGYASQPRHSYWDDFWAWRGFGDAAWLAGRLDRPAAQRRWHAVQEEFGSDLARSVQKAMTHHGIDYVPGCAELGDFDATSTSIALAPTGAATLLPGSSVERTFERWWEFFEQRREQNDWEVYTPYELRNVEAMVRLGWRDRAHEVLEWLGGDRRPTGWRHWAEVVGREPREPRFLGDMPHTWVGSDFLRAVVSMLAHVDGDTLVLAAGVPSKWIEELPGVELRGLSTELGLLDLRLRGDSRQWSVRVGGNARVPAGGVRLDLPLDRPPRAVEVDGRALDPVPSGPLRLDHLPTTVTLRF